MMHISVGDDDATTLLQEKRGRWWSNSSAVPFRSATLEWVTRLDVDCF
ncbi:hypothetical protein FOC4_g10006719 [Fusarium odoratissimum]|uniref:Uncharacterized protein n=1 Tax=Fusarium oxysporum f. sp. cubense (strain race 4) TaxID=2502994 RepID=N1RIB2_FUSC4|nr:hypothetical protein FOC4_g10006719 [Fusarium odoratissimum]